MTDRIELRGLRAWGYHGVLPDERANGQPFLVDAVLHVDTAPAAASDDLADTVDYAALARDIEAVVAGDPVNLIETLAGRVAATCLRDPRVRAAAVTVHKPEAPVGVPVADVVVHVERHRGEETS